MNYRFFALARWDLYDAADWYDARVPGLGDEFTNEVEAKVQDIVRMPRLYPRVEPRKRGREIRQALVRRFPYLVIYEVTATEVVIFAVVYARSSNRKWRRRI
jgi:plasmid stabilization system protein ParE